ncbi:MAG TPA: hypothetical protein VIR77_05555 [Pontiella sp.]
MIMMKYQTIGILFLFAAVQAPVSAIEYTPERYDLIVERSPFGKEDLSVAAPSAGQNAAAAKAAERELRLCFLLETDAGDARAGFENKTARPGDPKNVMLMEDDEFRGMRVLDIDLDSGRVIMSRDGNEVTFELKKAMAAPATAPTAQKPALPQRRFGGGFRPAAPQQQPQPEPAGLSPEEEARQRELVRAQLQEYQMEVLRKGQPPLPIQLTPEMDDQLVAEGVLEPQ